MRGGGGVTFEGNSHHRHAPLARRPFGPARPFIEPSPMSSKEGRLARLVNDIRYGSFIIVDLPGKLQKRERLLPIFKRENKGINLTKMV